MKKYPMCLMALLLGMQLSAQRPTTTTTPTSADTTWLTVYNTGVRYLLKFAPFGEQKPDGAGS